MKTLPQKTQTQQSNTTTIHHHQNTTANTLTAKTPTPKRHHKNAKPPAQAKQHSNHKHRNNNTKRPPTSTQKRQYQNTTRKHQHSHHLQSTNATSTPTKIMITNSFPDKNAVGGIEKWLFNMKNRHRQEVPHRRSIRPHMMESSNATPVTMICPSSCLANDRYALLSPAAP